MPDRPTGYYLANVREFVLGEAQNTVPYDAFMTLGNALPEVQRPLMIYMSGRSGSTLLSHILNDSGAVVSLSEPDVATQFSHFWSEPGGSRDNELRLLAQSAVRFLFKPYPSDNGKAHAIKFRAEGLRSMDLFQSALPEVKNLFSYRDALGWANSFYRILRNYQPNYSTVNDWLDMLEIPLKADLSYLVAYLETNQEAISIPE